MFMSTNRIQVTGLAVILLLGCGGAGKPDKFFDPDLVPFLEKFISEADDHGVDMPGLDALRVLRFVDGFPGIDTATKRIMGLCKKRTVKGSGYVSVARRWREVLIRRPVDGRARVDNKIIEYIVYHELGHCLLNLDHSPPLGAPRIMRPSVSMASGGWLNKNWTAVVGEFFTFGNAGNASMALSSGILPETTAASNEKEVCGLTEEGESDDSASLSNLLREEL